MKPTNLTIKDFFTDKAKLTFLVGAGCSVDAPSCLPAGRAMMDAIIKHLCVESEKDKIFNLKELRFEQLIKIVRDVLDPEIKIIDYYGLCDKPNTQHFFLAEMIKRGNFVMTTNFDFLIEYALFNSKVPKDEIIPVITKIDFLQFDDPKELFKKEKKAVYKIHGSTKNVITGENTRDSLIATIQALGLNKEGLNVFQVEPYKRQLFINITENRSLVIIGYSGSDDFDIIPTLKVLKNLRNIIWINFIKNDGNKEEIFEIEIEDVNNDNNLDKVNQILVDIKRMKNADGIYRVDVNTSRLINELYDVESLLNTSNFSVNLIDWIKNNVEIPNEMIKYFISFSIYSEFIKIDDMIRCANELLNIAETLKNQTWKAKALNSVGNCYLAQGKYDMALNLYGEALSIDEELNKLDDKADILMNVGVLHGQLRQYTKALKHFEEALQIYNQFKNQKMKATCYSNIGMVHHEQKNYEGALESYKMMIKINQILGDILLKANGLTNIGMIYHDQKNYDKALEMYNEAFQIYDQLRSQEMKANSFNNIGEIYYDQQNYFNALEYYKKALQTLNQIEHNKSFQSYGLKDIIKFNISKSKEDLILKLRKLMQKGLSFYQNNNYPDALSKFKESFKISRTLNDVLENQEKFNILFFSGMSYYKIKNHLEALNKFKEALKISRILHNVSEHPDLIYFIGSIHVEQENYFEALKYFEELSRIHMELKEPLKVIIAFHSIGLIYEELKDYSKALEHFNKAFKIVEVLRLSEDPQFKPIKEKIKSLEKEVRKKKSRN